MWTAAGLETVVTEVTSYVEGFGEVSGLHMPLSPNLLSVGVKVEDCHRNAILRSAALVPWKGLYILCI